MTIQTPIRIPAFNGCPAPDRGTDYCSAGGAELLAARIARTWALHGFKVKVWAEPAQGTARMGGSLGGVVHVVRSDLRNGMPR